LLPKTNTQFNLKGANYAKPFKEVPMKKLWYDMFDEIFKDMPDEIRIVEEEMSKWQW
jgi:hypothetical protein